MSKTITKNEVEQKFDLGKYKSKSDAIRQLTKDGMSRGDISRYMNIRYQHVRNVLITPLVGKKN